MNSKKIIGYLFIFTVLLICSTQNLYAPPSPPGGGGGPGCGGPWTCIPIDGGISILLGLGVLFGGKKLLDAEKDNK